MTALYNVCTYNLYLYYIYKYIPIHTYNYICILKITPSPLCVHLRHKPTRRKALRFSLQYSQQSSRRKLKLNLEQHTSKLRGEDERLRCDGRSDLPAKCHAFAPPTGESKSDTQPIQSEAWQGSTTDRPLTSRDLFKGRVRLKS